jgi:putative transposase
MLRIPHLFAELLRPFERQAVLAVLHSERFCDAAPAEVYATLLDEGTYLCSERTMYRILAAEGETRERRSQLVHPAYHKPELLAEAPNQLWTWDITKLVGPAKWTYFYLYVILDVFSRYVFGWMVAHRESAELAQRLIAETAAKQQIAPGQFTLHADRGSSMTSKPVAFLLADLGITKTHSRPHVSNDNPYSESQFKTLKYRPGFPDRFLSMEKARSFCCAFFPWYNTSITTAVSATARRRPCTPARLRPSTKCGARRWRLPTRCTRNGSCSGRLCRLCCRRLPGSTDREWSPDLRAAGCEQPASIPVSAPTLANFPQQRGRPRRVSAMVETGRPQSLPSPNDFRIYARPPFAIHTATVVS